ncbi:MAG: hypothetical protein ABIV21_01160, partial [Pyrinomonadaceae bacterium]
MNSKELELSLRSEFESYLKGVFAEMRQEATEFQSRIEAEFDNHKAQFDEAFRSYAERFDATGQFDEAFSSSVAEHLRLARDEGARITATAMAEAEKLAEKTAPGPEPAPAAKFDLLRDAVNEISSKGSQAAILKTLVEHAAKFAPRGAFFIVKSGHFVGWKVFGEAADDAEDAVRDIHFAISSDTILSEAVRSLNTVQGPAGERSDDTNILEPLKYGDPERMYAVPLVARGRGVAVLYADHGSEESSVNREALETLVRVAGLTVELLASSSQAAQQEKAVPADFEDAQYESADEPSHTVEARASGEGYETPSEPVEPSDEVPVDDPRVSAEPDNAGFAFSENTPFEAEYEAEPSFASAEPGTVEVDGFVLPEAAAEYPAANDFAFEAFDGQPFEAEALSDPAEAAVASYDAEGTLETDVPSPFDESLNEYEPGSMGTSSSRAYSAAVEQVVEKAPTAVPYERLSDRLVDLPIEVPDEERRIHNEARRFARLLVSEIKLYNEK